MFNSFSGGSGLAVAWSESVACTVLDATPSYLVVECQHPPLGKFAVIFVHLSCDVGARQVQLNEIIMFVLSCPLPLFVAGDFNCLLSMADKVGGRPLAPAALDQLGDFLHATNLTNLGCIGSPYTWSNRQSGSKQILERLDRCLANNLVLCSWPDVQVHHLTDLGSDHRMLLIRFTKTPESRPRRFQFDKRWTTNPEVPGIFETAWAKRVQGTTQFRVQTQLKHLRHDLVGWASKGTSNSARQIRTLRQTIEEARESPVVDLDHIKALENQLGGAYKQEEAFWKQKSRVGRLRKGDANTGFFHLTTMQRRRRNAILTLCDDEGVVHTQEDAKANVAITFYQRLFTSNGSDPRDFVRQLGLPRVVDD
ncbi:unnamed protein product [Linum trigynum]|uniref:Endonuclease/exonuclease/phosphatase domain-containing protein n=1 Tax=Linum trigynum TaxID=586398 RepID=A0AAV2G8D4_9ROSI